MADKAIGFTSEAIIRLPDGKLVFIGAPTDGRCIAVENLNNGIRKERDLELLEGVPVFDEADVQEAPLTIVPYLEFERRK